jgi:hypothetical protein
MLESKKKKKAWTIWTIAVSLICPPFLFDKIYPPLFSCIENALILSSQWMNICVT